MDQLINTRKGLEHLTLHDISSLDSEGEEHEEEEASEDDLMFIDDRPSGSSKRRYGFNDDDDIPLPKQVRQGNDASTALLNPFDDSKEEEESDDNDDETEPEYADDMSDFDYRRATYTPPSLTPEEKELWIYSNARVYTHMNTWIPLGDSKNVRYHRENHSTAASPAVVLPKLNMHTPKMYLSILT